MLHTRRCWTIDMELGERTRFFLRNMIRGLLWLGAIVVIFIIVKEYAPSVHYKQWLEPIYDRPLLMPTVFAISEVAFGIIPPEVFMIWATTMGGIATYVIYVVIFAGFSYLAGIIGYMIGNYLHHTVFYRYLRRRYMSKYVQYFHKYGSFLIIVASMTPLPFSAISMLVGSVKYPFDRFLFYALFRFVRFAAYSVIIYQANAI
ncbi:MAG: VTT domain-containing protein [Bacteroidales bacterium]|nr:VTT domain-containing protein [Bacteroidales bacterium]